MSIQSTLRCSLVKKIVLNYAKIAPLLSKNFHYCFNAVSFIHRATNDPTHFSATNNHSVLKGLSAQKQNQANFFGLQFEDKTQNWLTVRGWG